MNEIKCRQCGTWTSSEHQVCSHCGFEFRAAAEKEREERKPEAMKPLDIPMIIIREEDHPLLKFVKKILRIPQLIFYSIVSFLVWMAVWAVG